MSDEMTRLDEIESRLEATDNGYGAFSALRPEFDALLAVVREVAGLHQPYRTECLNPRHETDCEAAQICKTCDHIWPCQTGRALQALTESKERNHEV